MSKPLRFEGAVQINAPCSTVWRLVEDVATLQRLMPSIKQAVVLEPQHQFEVTVGVPFWTDAGQQTFQLSWSNVVVGKQFDWVATTTWAQQPVICDGWLHLDEATQLTFSAEITLPPHAPPRTMVHRVAEQAIRSYFTSLKREAESLART